MKIGYSIGHVPPDDCLTESSGGHRVERGEEEAQDSGLELGKVQPVGAVMGKGMRYLPH